MAKPASVPTWATDTNYTNGPTGIPGTATKVAPSAGQRAEGWIPKNKPAAQWLNHLLNAICAWLVYLDTWFNGSDEIIYPVVKTRVVQINAFQFCQMYADGTPGTTVPPWAQIATGSAPDQWITLQSQTDFAKLFLNLSDVVPSGAQITLIRMLLQPGTARATAGNRARMRVHAMIFNFGAVTVGGSGSGPLYEVTDDGTANLQVRTTGAIALNIDKNVSAGGGQVLQIIAGNDAGTNKDLFHAVEITYTDPGPRNY